MAIQYITTSQVNLFKDCRRSWEISYKEMVKPIRESDALVIGSSYHDKVEQILKTGGFTETNEVTDAMAKAFIKYILPQYPEMPTEVEETFDKSIARGVHLLGKVDGRSKNYLFEHKTTSMNLEDGSYEYNVHYNNDQVSNYLIANKKNIPVIYDVIKKPTIRQKQKETLEEYIKRCEDWYDEDTEKKILVFEVYRTDEELAAQREFLINIAKEMKHGFIYPNHRSCSIGSSCPFKGVCGNNTDWDAMADYTRKKQANEELEKGDNKWL